MRVLVLLPMLLCAALRPAGAEDVMGAVRADNWDAAMAAAARYPDPVAAKLVTYYRLLKPGAATAAEIAAFMTQNPDWPAQPTLAKRRDEALAAEPDDAIVRALCASARPQMPGALLRCAAASREAGETAQAASLARAAWRTGLAEPPAEQAFLQAWGGVPTPDDQWARFDFLAWSDSIPAATRQLARLDPVRRALGEVRLAYRRDDPKAQGLSSVVPEAVRHDPGLFYDRARWLRRANQDATSAALWRSEGDAAQRAALPEHLPAFWAERNTLARRLLTEGEAADAYALAAGHGQTEPEFAADAEFLAGFIALRRLHDPAAASRHFQTLAGVSKAAITNARAQYWLGRGAEASGGDPRPPWRLAASWPTTFYGQLAALALGEDAQALDARITALRDPAWDREQVLGFADREVTRAAALLVAWGEPRRAHAFILRLDDLAPAPADQALAAHLALGFALPDQAVAVARRAGREGLVLAESGWPIAVDPPSDPVEPAVTLGLIRQESSFDIAASSPAGARGLMQLMPATAEAIARQVGAPVSLAALTSDPGYNMQLGTAYLRAMLDQFAGVLPLAIAAYNAGPNRVLEWLASNGDPRLAGVAGQPDMVDWIELIPFSETRNYVQRVIENVMIYRARLHALHGGPILPHPLAAARPG